MRGHGDVSTKQRGAKAERGSNRKDKDKGEAKEGAEDTSEGAWVDKQSAAADNSSLADFSREQACSTTLVVSNVAAHLRRGSVEAKTASVRAQWTSDHAPRCVQHLGALNASKEMHPLRADAVALLYKDALVRRARQHAGSLHARGAVARLHPRRHACHLKRVARGRRVAAGVHAARGYERAVARVRPRSGLAPLGVCGAQDRHVSRKKL